MNLSEVKKAQLANRKYKQETDNYGNEAMNISMRKWCVVGGRGGALLLVMGLSFMGVVSRLQAQVYTGTWDGGGADNSWTTGANWAGDVAPTSSTTTSVTLNGVTRLTPDIASDYSINYMTFDYAAGAFTLGGSGVINLNGANNYTMYIKNRSSNTQTINNNIFLNTASGIGIDYATGAASHLVINGNIATNAKSVGLINNSTGSTLTVNGVISGSGQVYYYGNNSGGTVVANGLNSYSGGTYILGGTALINQNVSASGNGAFGTGTVQLGSNANSSYKLLTSGNVTMGKAITIASTTGANNNQAFIGGATSDSSTYSGIINMGSASGAANALTISSVTGGRVNVTGNLSRNTGATGTADNLTKVGTGTVVLGGSNNNYAGNTQVSAGTLLVNGSIANTSTTSVGVVTVGDSAAPATLATLGGAGTINRSISVLDNGIVSAGDMNLAGNSLTGTLSVVGDFSLASASLLKFDLGTAKDRIAITGNLLLDGVLDVTAGTGFGEGTYTLFTYTGSLTDNTLSLGNMPTGLYTYSIDTTTTGIVALNVVPEPGTLALAILGAMLLLGKRRQSSKE
ncbi:MAG: hypothetical protein B9S32_04210 [Verrucomicrobia bacterium Tous-C9LFEB]|nr:MAG: hypothetical protein B9S32_04210 [Verrucomicrobia bacterium Tous-C9LFEB]